MIEQQQVTGRLNDAGVLAGIRWAYASAVRRTLDDFSEEAGYDSAWLGTTRFTLFRDRLDRVFSCGRYALQTDADPGAGLDLVRAELTEAEYETMPVLAPGLVVASYLNQSPGWRFEDIRILLASAVFEKIETLPWPQKSVTKQRVARQPSPEPVPSLFDELVPDEVGGLLALHETSLDLDTFVVAHSLDPVSQRRELVLGRPRLNDGGGEAWHWWENLLAGPSTTGGRRIDVAASSLPDTTPDAPVRLRVKAGAEPEAEVQK